MPQPLRLHGVVGYHISLIRHYDFGPNPLQSEGREFESRWGQYPFLLFFRLARCVPQLVLIREPYILTISMFFLPCWDIQTKCGESGANERCVN